MKSNKVMTNIKNTIFSNNLLKSQDTNYIIGIIVALLSSSILHGNIRVTFFNNNLLLRVLFMTLIIVISKINIVLASILGFLYVILHLNTSINESFANIDDSDEDPNYSYEDDSYNEVDDMDDDQKKQNIKELSSGEDEESYIDPDDKNPLESENEIRDVYGSEDNDDSNEDKSNNQCLIRCLNKKYSVEKCKEICDDICVCNDIDIDSDLQKNMKTKLPPSNESKLRNNYKKLQNLMDDDINDLDDKTDDDMV